MMHRICVLPQRRLVNRGQAREDAKGRRKRRHETLDILRLIKARGRPFQRSQRGKRNRLRTRIHRCAADSPCQRRLTAQIRPVQLKELLACRRLEHEGCMPDRVQIVCALQDFLQFGQEKGQLLDAGSAFCVTWSGKISASRHACPFELLDDRFHALGRVLQLLDSRATALSLRPPQTVFQVLDFFPRRLQIRGDATHAQTPHANQAFPHPYIHIYMYIAMHA